MKKVLRFLLLVIGLYFFLLIPFSKTKNEFRKASETPFIWNQDTLWAKLETTFQEAKSLKPETLDTIVHKMSADIDSVLVDFEQRIYTPEDSIFKYIETKFYQIAPFISAQQEKSDWYIHFYNRIRKKLKSDSRFWDMDNKNSRKTSYRILYGMRAAVEEILLQSTDKEFTPTTYVTDEPSLTPSSEILKIKVHSGDLLVSRGGAEVSAFISRGNDYPGNFSHVAIIHVDKDTNKPYFVEAHIEKGVALATMDEYLNDKKLRFMVMRPRFDLPELIANPMLPYEASEFIYNESQKRHIPYDFKMDYFDSSAMFCSEVGSYAYRQFGIDLWKFESTISSQGTINWLHTFGVENFVTQMPSDLEYDPMLSVVAEWRNKDILFQDHVDNAVMDALISSANEGEELDYNIWLLPIAKVIKGYSFILTSFGKGGIIPEGMDAVSVLKNNTFVERFQDCKSATNLKIEAFKEFNGYLPPYWQLVKFAEASL